MTKANPTPSRSHGLSEILYRAAILTPVLIAILLMLPRLLSPQFGLYDDGRMLVTADKIAHGTWYTGLDRIEGRFRPVYWLWFTLSFLMGGNHPLWFFVANTVALVGIIAGLIFLVRGLGGSRLQACLAGLLFVLAGPVPESFLTLKGEVIQLVWMLLSFSTLPLYMRAKKRSQKIGSVALTAFTLLLAYLTKETALVLLPISLAWYLLARFWKGYESEPARLTARGAYLLANLIAAPLFFLMRTTALPSQLAAGTYSGQYLIALGQMAVSAVRWAGWLARDFIWVVPMTVMGIVLLVRRRKLSGRTILFDSSIWMGAWICVYLPWNFMAEYYMLPFALGLAVFVSALIVEITLFFRESGGKRWTAIGVLGLSLVLLAGELMNNLTNIRMQLAIDSTNARMMAFLVQNTEPGSTLLVNIQDPNEYYYEMQTQLGQIDNRPDLKLRTFNRDMTLANDTGPLYIVTPYVQNQPLLSVRMGVVQITQNNWDRLLQGYLRIHPGWQSVFETATSFPLSNVNYPRLFCPLIKTRAFCATPEPVVDVRPFNYGWTIYQLKEP